MEGCGRAKPVMPNNTLPGSADTCGSDIRSSTLAPLLQGSNKLVHGGLKLEVSRELPSSSRVQNRIAVSGRLAESQSEHRSLVLRHKLIILARDKHKTCLRGRKALSHPNSAYPRQSSQVSWGRALRHPNEPLLWTAPETCQMVARSGTAAGKA